MRKSFKMVVISCMVVLGLIIMSWLLLHQKQPQNNTINEQQTISIDIQNAFSYDNIVPIVILGSGCAGLSAGIYGARSNIRTVIISGNKPGGQLSETTYVENWPGSTKVLGSDIIKSLKDQAVHFGAQYVDDAVISIDIATWPYTLQTEHKRTIHALTVIIATGAQPKLLDIPGEKEYFGKGVTTCAICDAAFHAGNDVVVIGGGDSAAEEALQLAHYAKTVTIIVRKDAMRASAAMQQRLAAEKNISITYNSEITHIMGDQKEITSVKIFNNRDKTTIVKNVSGVFLAIGHIPNTALFKNAVKTDQQGYIIMHDRTQHTSTPAIFAAGDVEDFRYRQAGVASGSGIKAALDAISFLEQQGFNATIAEQMMPQYLRIIDERKVSLPEVDNINSFNDLLRSSSQPLLVDFYTPFCSSCKHMLPALENMAYKYANSMKFVKVDASKAMDIAQQYHVNTVPCILVFKKGVLVARYNQALSQQELSDFIQTLLKEE